MKHVRVVALAITAVLVLSACGSSSSALKAPNTVQKGKLTVCTNVPYEPFEFLDGSTYKGIDVDLITAIAKDLKLTVQFSNVDFDSTFTDLEAGKCDVIASSVSITDERQAKYLFSDGYFEVNQSLMVQATKASTYSSLPALTGHKIGVQNATTGADYVAAHATGATAVGYDDTTKMQSDLENGTLAGIVQDFPINSYLAQKSPSDLKVVQTFSDVEREQYGFVMQKNATALQASVNSSLAKIRKSGKYDQILSDYLGSATGN